MKAAGRGKSTLQRSTTDSQGDGDRRRASRWLLSTAYRSKYRICPYIASRQEQPAFFTNQLAVRRASTIKIAASFSHQRAAPACLTRLPLPCLILRPSHPPKLPTCAYVCPMSVCPAAVHTGRLALGASGLSLSAIPSRGCAAFVSPELTIRTDAFDWRDLRIDHAASAGPRGLVLLRKKRRAPIHTGRKWTCPSIPLRFLSQMEVRMQLVGLTVFAKRSLRRSS